MGDVAKAAVGVQRPLGAYRTKAGARSAVCRGCERVTCAACQEEKDVTEVGAAQKERYFKEGKLLNGMAPHVS